MTDPHSLPPSPPAKEHSLPDGRLTALPVTVKWLLLACLSLALGAALEYAGLPAALLLGPMIAAILMGTNGARLALPKMPYMAAQALIGCLIAQSLDKAILQRFMQEWPIFLGSVLSVILLSSLIGYIMARRQVLPGTTAVWGTSAGAASAMVVMADAYGADARLVAFMQYLRVVCVASTAAIMAAFVFQVPGGHPPAFVLFPPVDWPDLALTILAVAIFAMIGNRLRINAGTMIGPMVGMALLNGTGLLTIELPEWLLALAYTMVGWRIGLAFTGRLLRHAAKALPRVFLSIVILIGFGGILAALLTHFLGIDPLTAYLATSPGGLDSVAIIAASTKVDMSFVMALQTVRFLLILALGPSISRFIANRIKT